MSSDTHLGELLGPVAQAIEAARMVLMVGALVVMLLWGGAKLERLLMKRRLEVLDGAAAGGDIDLEAARHGSSS